MAEKSKLFRGLGKYANAIEYLKVSKHAVETNEPINRKEGNIAQADSEKEDAESINAAIKRLLGRK